MGLLDQIIAGGVGTALGAFGTFARDLREAITGKAILDPNKQAELLMRAQEMEQAAMMAMLAYDKSQMEGQLIINKVEAESGSLFKGGWRPATGWVCVSGLFYEFLLRPLLPWIVSVGGIIVGKTVTVPTMTSLDLEQLLVILFGMLGLGSQRMMEKKWKVASK